MATVQQRSTATTSTNGDGAIQVENPATGEVIGDGPRPVRRRGRRDRRARSRRAAGVGGARASTAAPGSCAGPRSGSIDNAERIIETIVSETGKTYEDAQLAEISYAANAFGFWAKNAPEYLADEKVKSSNPFVTGRKLIVRYRPARRGRRDRARGTTRSRTPSATASRRWPPATRCILKPSRGHPADARC